MKQKNIRKLPGPSAHYTISLLPNDTSRSRQDDIQIQDLLALTPGTSAPRILTRLISPPATAMAKAKKNHLPHHFVATPLASAILGGPAGRGGSDLTSREAPLIDLSYCQMKGVG